MLNLARQVFGRSFKRSAARNRDMVPPAPDILADALEEIWNEPEVPDSMDHVQILMSRIPFQRESPADC